MFKNISKCEIKKSAKNLQCILNIRGLKNWDQQMSNKHEYQTWNERNCFSFVSYVKMISIKTAIVHENCLW